MVFAVAEGAGENGGLGRAVPDCRQLRQLSGDAACPLPEQVDRAAGPLWGWGAGGCGLVAGGNGARRPWKAPRPALFSPGLLKRVQLPLT